MSSANAEPLLDTIRGPYAITTIQLRGDAQNSMTANTVLGLLSEVVVTDDGRAHWPLLKLEIPSLGRSQRDSTLVLNMLKRRYGLDGEHTSTDRGWPRALPEPLTRLGLTEKAGDAVLQEIRSIVGLEKVDENDEDHDVH